MLSISAVWLSPHPARLPAVKGKSTGCSALLCPRAEPRGAPRAGAAEGPGPWFGSRSWHSSMLGVLLAVPGDSEQEQAEEDAELFLLGHSPLQHCARSAQEFAGSGNRLLAAISVGCSCLTGNAHFGDKRGLTQPRPSENHCICHCFTLLCFVSLVCFSVAGLCSHLPQLDPFLGLWVAAQSF